MSELFANFFEGLFNIFLFLPYFFSIPSLFKTLFKPWKNLVEKKTVPGFSFQEWFSRFSFNLISRFIGFCMRLSIILFFLFVEALYILILPFLIIIFVFFSPLIYLLKTLQKPEEEKRDHLKSTFISKHVIKQENTKKAEDWFNAIYLQTIKKKPWWKLESLFSTPPLATDWAAGYTPTLDKYTQELTSGEYQQKIKNAVGRSEEIIEIEQTLSKNGEANVILVGEEGAGKQTVIDFLAKKIYEGQSNSILNYKRVLKLNLEAILAEYTDQKQREESLESLFSEASEAKNIILVIDQLDKYISTGGDRVNLSIPIAKFAKETTLQFIATSTPFSYEKFIYSNEATTQLFTRIDINEVSQEKALEIILNLIPSYENKYQLIIPYETALETIDKSEFYITNIPFPEKAIELLDSTCAYVVQGNKKIITPQDIDQITAQTTHAPVSLDSSTKKTLVDFETILSTNILGQPEATKELAAALRRSFLQLGKRKKPLASFLFFGPTGVGKTETAKILAQIFFHDQKHLLRFDMSLYQSKNDIPNLIGFQDNQQPGQLTQAIRNNPYSVLLLDEIEKAHPDLLNIFLTILDEGYFTDSIGKRVDCKNLIIIATSNAGSDLIFKQLKERSYNQNVDLISYLVNHNFFSPEFLNRFDGVIAYKPLDQNGLLGIARRIINKLAENYLKNQKIYLTVSDQTLTGLVQKGYHPEFGARNLERTILEQIEDRVSKGILQGELKEGQKVEL